MDKFSVQHRDGVVYLDWLMSTGSVCLGIQIERSDDSTNYTEIGFIGGICGSLTKPAAYSFQDNTPVFNKRTYYRLTYPGLGSSEAVSILVIHVEKNDYETNPTPSTGQTKLNFYNPRNESHHLKVTCLTGLEVLSLDTTENYFEFNAAELEPGIYQFIIYNSSRTNTVSGRILVVR